MSKLHTKRGNLTAYGLSCGYVETSTNNNIKVQLSYEHNTYHVKAKYVSSDGRWHYCITADTLKDARAEYKQMGGILK